MPEITPLEIAGPITVTPRTTAPSQKMVPQVAQPPVTEPLVETAKPPETKHDELDSNRIAALAKREKDIRRQILREREQHVQEKKLLEEKYRPYAEAAELAKSNKLEAIKKMGFSYDELTNQLLNQGVPSPEQLAEMKAQEIVQREIAALRKQQEESAAEQTQNNYKQALTQITNEAKDLVTGSQDFPLVKEMQAFDTIVALIESQFHETGRVMPVEVAAKEVEQYLEEQTLKIAKLDKVRSKLLQEESKQTQAAPVNQKQQTLTHKTTVSPAGSQPLTASDRRQRAIDIFYGRA